MDPITNAMVDADIECRRPIDPAFVIETAERVACPIGAGL
jgi:hypothetical protein